MRYSFLIVVCFLMTTPLVGQDLVVRTNGDSIKCQILSESEHRVAFKTYHHGKKITTGLDQAEISSIVYGFYDHRPNHAVYGFLGGGFILGGRYDYTAHGSGFAQMSVSVGVGGTEDLSVLCLFGGCDEPERYAVFVHQFTVVMGRGQHLLELGAGGTYYHGMQSHKEYHLAPVVGYRFYPKLNSGLAVRLILMPPIFNTDTEIIPGPLGLGVGFAF
ncbi:hypothetical protein [Marinoscillum furvescens]|nr:hypothetical protein [Marinoscillum furvescens]